MPRRTRKSSAQSGRAAPAPTSKTDFTLYDFAHADHVKLKAGCGRLKKNAGCEPMNTKFTKLDIANVGTMKLTKKEDSVDMNTSDGEDTVKGTKEEESLAWYERDLSDYDLDSVELDVDDETNKTVTKSPRRKKKREKKQTGDGGQVYPIDFWFLLGNYIYPESVSTFAQLCKWTHYVTHSVIFWQTMYKRFYRDDLELPNSLRPRHLEQIHGLRSRVISSLFYCYSPFMERLLHITSFQCDPDTLEGATCVLTWHQKVKSLWHFYFKFKRQPQKLCSLTKTITNKRRHFTISDFLLDDADVFYNPEEYCCVLQLILDDFVPVPPMVMGEVLSKTLITVGHQMRYHKVKMVFSAGYMRKATHNHSSANGTVLILDPVLNMNLLHWWHPQYPSKGSFCKSPPLLSPDAFG